MTQQIQFNDVQDGIDVKEFISACDDQVSGFRLGVEVAKAQFIKYLQRREAARTATVPGPVGAGIDQEIK